MRITLTRCGSGETNETSGGNETSGACRDYENDHANGNGGANREGAVDGEVENASRDDCVDEHGGRRPSWL